MKVIHLISGGDTGGAKTHVHSLLQGLDGKVELTMVCFMEGPFAQEARELGIPTVVLPGHNVPRILCKLKHMILTGKYDIIHCHGARGNMMGSLLRRMTGLPVITTVHSDYRLDYLGRFFSRLTYGTINTIALRTLDYPSAYPTPWWICSFPGDLIPTSCFPFTTVWTLHPAPWQWIGQSFFVRWDWMPMKTTLSSVLLPV